MKLILLVLSFVNLVCLLFLLKHTDKAIKSLRSDVAWVVSKLEYRVWLEIEKIKKKTEDVE